MESQRENYTKKSKRVAFGKRGKDTSSISRVGRTYISSSQHGSAVPRPNSKALDRLISLAVETGARFEREDLDHDPLVWLYTPKDLFGGATPIQACSKPDAFALAMRLHARGVGIDAAARDLRSGPVDQLLSQPVAADAVFVPDGPNLQVVPESRQLFSSTIVDLDGPVTLHVFHAIVAPNRDAAREALSIRYGLRLASLARTAVGFDPSDPIAISLVADATALILEQVAADPKDSLGEGFEVQFEAKFAS